MYWCWSLLRYWAVCYLRFIFLLSRTGYNGRFNVVIVWFNLKIGSLETFQGTGWFCGWLDVTVYCCVVCCGGILTLNEEVGWLFCWLGRYVLLGGVWKGLLWVGGIFVVADLGGSCWDVCPFPPTGGILIPKLPKMPPNPWFRSPILPKEMVVACGCPNPKLPNRLANGLNGCCCGCDEVFAPCCWDCCWDYCCDVCWVLFVFVVEVVVCYCCCVVLILAIKWTVLPDYFTTYYKKLHTIICNFILVN